MIGRKKGSQNTIAYSLITAQDGRIVNLFKNFLSGRKYHFDIGFRLFALTFLILAAAVSLAGCQKANMDMPAASQVNENKDSGSSASDWYAVHFTTPQETRQGAYHGGPDEALAAAIENARISVDTAIYDLNLWSIRDALLTANRRGVKVRMVVESEYLDREEIQALREAEIPIVDDRRNALMHNKFTVIDRYDVWTGSMNYTINGAYWYDNNMVRINSRRISEDYTNEFDEMFVDHKFGSDSPANTPYPLVTINNQQVEVCFSPDDGVEDRLAALISNARESIYFLAFSFTSDKLAEAIIERARAGVDVKGVLDQSQIKGNKGGEYEHFLAAGLNVVPDGNPKKMHDKVIIIDNKILITGSYNFTASAARKNDENLLIFHSRDLASIYLKEFNRIWDLAY